MLTAAGALARLRAEDVPDELLAARAPRPRRLAVPAAGARRPGCADRRSERRGTTSLDPGWDPRERWDARVDAFDVLLPNARGGAAAGRPRGRRRRGRGPTLAARGPLVVVKLGRGRRAGRAGRRVDAGRRRRASTRSTATGAGDSFDAGFLAARLAGEDLAGGARARLRVRRAEHAARRRHRRAADARRGARVSHDRLRRRLAVDRPPARVAGAAAGRRSTGRERVVAVPGGKALNAARAAHALGARRPRHRAARRPHRALGGRRAGGGGHRRCDAVAGPGETRICAARQPTAAPLTEFYEPGPELGPSTGRRWRRRRREVAARRELGRRRRLAPARRARPTAYRPARCASPARPAPASRSTSAERRSGSGCAAGPDFVKVNASEAAELGIETAPELLLAAGGGDRAAAITHGADGIELATADGAVLRAAPPRARRATPSAAATPRSAASSPRSTSAATGPRRSTRAVGAAAANARGAGRGPARRRRAALARDVRVVDV